MFTSTILTTKPQNKQNKTKQLKPLLQTQSKDFALKTLPESSKPILGFHI